MITTARTDSSAAIVATSRSNSSMKARDIRLYGASLIVRIVTASRRSMRIGALLMWRLKRPLGDPRQPGQVPNALMRSGGRCTRVSGMPDDHGHDEKGSVATGGSVGAETPVPQPAPEAAVATDGSAAAETPVPETTLEPAPETMPEPAPRDHA